MKILTVANQKGGVGKSTLSVHIAHAAHERGLRVLLVDFDKQGNLSMSFCDGAGVDGAQSLTASRLFQSDAVLNPTRCGDFALIGADGALEQVEGQGDDVARLPRANLARLKKDFDLCVIDTPPAIGKILRGALIASDYVLTPFQMGLYEMAGARDLMNTLNLIRATGQNPMLKHIGILPMKINTKSPQEMQALQALQSAYGKAVLPYYIAERTAVKQAIARKKPVWTGATGLSHIRARAEWRNACDDILKRMGF